MTTMMSCYGTGGTARSRCSSMASPVSSPPSARSGSGRRQRPIILGDILYSFGGGRVVAMVRLNPDAALDGVFGDACVLRITSGRNKYDPSIPMGFAADGALVILGQDLQRETRENSASEAILARVLAGTG